MSQQMIFKDVVKPAMVENSKKYLEILANITAQKKVEEKIAKGVKELEAKRSQQEKEDA